MTNENKHLGSSLDDFLREEVILLLIPQCTSPPKELRLPNANQYDSN